MNYAIEFHDSTIGALDWEGRDLVVRFVPAYVHGSDGRPGIDPGTGWLQDLDLRITEARIQAGPLQQVPCDVCDGSLTLDEGLWDNTIPLAAHGSVVLSVLTTAAETLLVQWRGASVIARGEPRFLEVVDF